MSANPDLVVPASILDTDLYKLSMQQAVLQHFSDVQGSYRFTHRDTDVWFNRKCFERFRQSIDAFPKLSLSDPELGWLRSSCPYFTPKYLEYLKQYRFNPQQVTVTFCPRLEDPDEDKGRIEIEVVGLWVETILWEVPLMACLSELYFRVVDTDWDYEGQAELAYSKGKTLFQDGCVVSEFGTRRRRSYQTQDLVIDNLNKASEKVVGGKGKLAGTSNVHFAQKHNIAVIGTIAHEWFMGVAAIKGYKHANSEAMKLWELVYTNSPLIALTDTFSTEAFYKDFDQSRARRWTGLRQDSGDPEIYAPRAKEIYTELGIDHSSKMIIYSDSLDTDKALKLKTQCEAFGFLPSFGIGTFLTNDFKSITSGRKEKSRALNMVIKLSSVDGNPCVKISDELTKNTGDQAAVCAVKNFFGINT